MKFSDVLNGQRFQFKADVDSEWVYQKLAIIGNSYNQPYTPILCVSAPKTDKNPHILMCPNEFLFSDDLVVE